MAGRRSPEDTSTGEVRLLSGGNPQIAKADGDAPVQAYIAAMPGWKSDVGRRIDDLIRPYRARRAQGGALELALVRHRGRRLVRQLSRIHPLREGDVSQRRVAGSCTAGSGKDPDSRWTDIYEGQLDEEQMAEWMRQAAARPGWRGF